MNYLEKRALAFGELVLNIEILRGYLVEIPPTATEEEKVEEAKRIFEIHPSRVNAVSFSRGVEKALRELGFLK